MDAIDGLLTRHSQGQLTAPAPDAAALERAFACALRAPDHRLLRPWRYLVVTGEGLARLGELFVAASRAENPALTAAEEERLRKMPLRAPMVVVAITAFRDDAKVPRDEQLLSTGAAVQNFLVALHAQGFAGMWRTGPLAVNADVRAGLGLAGNEVISGFLYVGTAAGEPRKVAPPAVRDFVATWTA